MEAPARTREGNSGSAAVEESDACPLLEIFEVAADYPVIELQRFAGSANPEEPSRSFQRAQLRQ